jgi:hypothetical protein
LLGSVSDFGQKTALTDSRFATYENTAPGASLNSVQDSSKSI